MSLLYITTTDGDEVWINPMHIVAIEPHNEGSRIRTAGSRVCGREVAPLTYDTDEAPTDLLESRIPMVTP